MWIIELILGLVTFWAPGGVTRRRGSISEMEALHPRSTVRRAELIYGAWSAEMGEVAFVVANPRGIGLRDTYGHLELQIESARIGSLDLLPADGFAGQRHRVRDRAGTVLVEFWSPEDAGDVHADVTAALRR